MTQGFTSLRQRALDLLILAGTWVPRADFAVLSTSPVVVDDVLADLVVEGKAQWRENSGYRLIGAPLARRAAQIQRRDGKRTVVLGQPFGQDSYHFGIAEVRAEPVGLVMYEIEVPMPADPAQALARIQAMAEAGIAYVDSRDPALPAKGTLWR